MTKPHDIRIDNYKNYKTYKKLKMLLIAKLLAEKTTQRIISEIHFFQKKLKLSLLTHVYTNKQASNFYKI